MFEELLAVGKSAKKYHPDSGPGSPFYVGDSDVGYFGEVPQTELFTSNELAAMYPKMTVINNAGMRDMPYLKFLYYGKVLFIKKFVCLYGAWSDFYDYGLIYGPEGKQNNLIKVDKNQTTVLTKNGNRFYIRSITGDETDIATQPTIPANPSNYSSDDKVRRRSMFTELMYRVMAGVVPNYPEKKFENYPYDEVMLVNSGEIGREIIERVGYPGLVASLSRVNAYVSSTSQRFTTIQVGYWPITNNSQWRPVLEYIPAAAPIQLYSFKTLQAPAGIKVDQTVNAIVTDLGDMNLVRIKKIVNKTVGIDKPSTIVAQGTLPVRIKNAEFTHNNMNKVASVTGVWIP